jgi:hypothetical protein
VSTSASGRDCRFGLHAPIVSAAFREPRRWVTTTNEPALRLYRRVGFRPKGRTQFLDHTPSLREIEMVRDP